MEPLVPTTPLTQDVTDLEVLDDVEVPLLCDSEEAADLLNLVEDYDRAEEFVRQDLLRKIRKAHHYWNSFQYLAWDETASDWRTPDEIMSSDPQSDIDPQDYAKVVNIYKAHGEILIGALTAGLPAVRFFPKDADDPEDVSTAKAYTKLSEILSKYNRAKLLLMKSLFLLYNEGMVACYNENKADYRFGTIKEPIYDDVPLKVTNHFCPNCGEHLGSSEPQVVDQPDQPDLSKEALPPQGAEQEPEAPAADPMMGEEGASPLVPQPQVTPPQGMPEPQVCPNCGQVGVPQQEDQHYTENQQVGEQKKPKNRECMEVWGPLNVKLPLWCKDQFSTPYLMLKTDEHIGLMREIYPELYDRLTSSAYPDVYEKEARVPTKYKYDFPRDLVSVTRVWLRPWAFNSLAKEKAKLFKEQYPKGCYIVIIEQSLVAEVVNDALDDHWTISENPLAETLHPEAIGSTAIPMQDITNELTNLTLETVEFGIPEIFADPRVIDFDEYDKIEARPGQISPATAPAGQNLSGGFHEVKASTLSREVDTFGQRIEQLTQLVMGSYPSIYGGAQDGGSGTAREYELSKASALQRLSTTWTILQEWWAKSMAKSVKSHAENLQEDEKMVQAKGSNFLNVWARKAEMGGEVLEPEISETFPVSWTQKRDVILNLIQMQNEDVAAVIRHPENAGLIAEIIGVPELYIPGDDDRSKQLMEIALLIRAEPQMPTGPDGQPIQPMPGQPLPPMKSTIPVEEWENHEVESEICESWLKSEVGQDAKYNNPGGYANVLAHDKEHDVYIQQAAMQAAMQGAQPGTPGGDSGGSGKPGPVDDKGLAQS